MDLEVTFPSSRELEIITFNERLDRLESLCDRQARQIEQLLKDNKQHQEDLYNVRELAKGVLGDLNSEVGRLATYIAEDRRRIATLERAPEIQAQPKQKDRAEILRSLLAAHNGKMLAMDARNKMGISKTAFSLLLKTLSDKIETKPLHLDGRKKLIILK